MAKRVSGKRISSNKIIMYMVAVLFLMVLFVIAGNVSGRKESADIYASFLESGDYAEDFWLADEVRYELAYIDEDDVPELLLAEGNGHVNRVAVYRYNEKNDKVEFLASFSSFGSLKYVPKGNIIISQYGNHGYYFNVYSEINDASVRLKDIFLSNAGGMESKYYHGFPVSEKFTGGFDKPNTPDDDLVYLEITPDAYRITEEEYNRLMAEIATGEQTVRYGEMKMINVE